MSANFSKAWFEANQRRLVRSLALVHDALDRRRLQLQSGGNAPGDEGSISDHLSADKNQLDEGAEDRRTTQAADPDGNFSPPETLDSLCASFGLSPFERDVLVLCAGMELDSRFGPLCAAASGEPARPFPTWGLALAALPEAHWSALTPVAPLRRWRLIEVGSGPNLITSPLRIDECVLHFLVGISHQDERLSGIVELIEPREKLLPSHEKLAAQAAETWSNAAGSTQLPVIHLTGAELAFNRAIAAAACAKLGMRVHVISVQVLPKNPSEVEALVRLFEREAALKTCALLLEIDESERSDKSREQAARGFIESARGAVLISSPSHSIGGRRPRVHFEVPAADPAEQRTIWKAALGKTAEVLNGQLEEVISQFNLSPDAIQSACNTALAGSENGDLSEANKFSQHLWNICRDHARPRLNDLAQRVEPRASWNDLVLPETQTRLLREIAMHVHQRARVYDTWGFGEKCARGLGVSALFAGPSGTGKTMAAEVLANELNVDLYRIDLSQVVSKYIGETEKNLRTIFDRAEVGGAILLFDEADALFGKRSEVKDSHDRYANIEVSYLLQRMEAYRGLAILTTNLKNSLDQAFQRRIRFIVHFPFPSAADRVRIWQRIFPARTPTENLDPVRLASLNIAGGNIRNIALNAAFLAADANEPVRMKHLRCAAQSEYTKMEKPLGEAEIGGWT